MNWDLTYHFKNNEEFENALIEVNNLVSKFKEFEGKLHIEENFVNYLKLSKEFEIKASKVYQYASLKSDLNKKNVENAANLNRCMMVLYQLSESIAYAEPELLSIGKETITKFIDNNKEVEEFRFNIEKLFHTQNYILDAKSEKLLSLFYLFQ